MATRALLLPRRRGAAGAGGRSPLLPGLGSRLLGGREGRKERRKRERERKKQPFPPLLGWLPLPSPLAAPVPNVGGGRRQGQQWRRAGAVLGLALLLPGPGLRLRGQPLRLEEPPAQPGTSLLALMGFRLEGIVPATLLPLLLTMVLFLGPLIQLSMDCPWDLVDGLKVAFDPRFWVLCLTDMRWLRNQVIAPFTEELVFRACMLPMLVPCTGLGPAIFTCPLFFGVVFQFSYTAVFGAYTAFIFIRTGHLIGPVLCHSFCNYVGFPAMGAALEHPQRVLVVFFYLLGVGLFLLLLHPMTDPAFFGHLPICSLSRLTSPTKSLGSFSFCS
ncbi:CAAX prenyl protease 2 isoform X2 [Anolis carolinensis]|uniref:CAAX prenyl protease 2 isoform X2 n=1 Tax=Anolis carolinensis TaxID=28377 RepID=UPI0007DB7232|nr:PREDICTED: CAAX prenyl protease 2 isoform X2 [Anolis carolinensis]|eukprot:XP_016853938.1 PREDICTED: CAAX prenyl protease 2 isoform X2 [Anolis carolinensis]